MISSAKQVVDITLFRGWLDPGRYVWSPFVTKLEARFRFCGIKYSTDSGGPRSAPKGKIPYVECRTQTEVTTQGDSTLITKKLVRQELLPDLNSNLSPEQAALDLSLRALLEDRLYFYHVSSPWLLLYSFLAICLQSPLVQGEMVR